VKIVSVYGGVGTEQAAQSHAAVLGVRFMQIQTYYCEGNRTADITS